LIICGLARLPVEINRAFNLHVTGSQPYDGPFTQRHVLQFYYDVLSNSDGREMEDIVAIGIERRRELRRVEDDCAWRGQIQRTVRTVRAAVEDLRLSRHTHDQ
jgi:hypothetical protein